MTFFVKPRPSIDRLRELFSYDPETGHFTRIVKRQLPAGTVAGSTKRNKGYISITVDRRKYQAHRLAWLWIYGTWPSQLDHINRDRADNRINNLRPATPTLNALNRSLQVTSRSGVTGVIHCDNWRLNPWSAQIMVNGKNVVLGYFAEKELAVAARAAALKVAEQFHNAAAA
jgi:HNH endonuclease